VPYDRYIQLERSDLAKAKLRKAVMDGPEAVETRWRSLHKATFMGNVREEKVRVFLQGDQDTVYRIDTTLWACTAEWVVFKDSVRIPVDQVIRVEFYHSSDE